MTLTPDRTDTETDPAPGPERTPALPPGPRRPMPFQAWAFMRRRSLFVPAMHRRFGDVFTLRLPPGARPIVLLSRPEHIKQAFAGDPERFRAGAGNAVLKPVMGDHSVLLLDGDQHARARRLLMPAFGRAALKRYAGMIDELAEVEVDGWRDGQVLETHERMNAVTLEIILRVVFGVADGERLDRIRPMVQATVDIRPLMLLGAFYPGLQRVGPWRRFALGQERFNTELYALIAERRTEPDLAERDDVLSQLLAVGADGDAETGDGGLTDAELRDQLVTLLLAGHETTASALSWTLHELALNPGAQARVRDAADAGDGALVEAALKEGMRLHPIIDQVHRVLTEPTEVAGHLLPRGTTVAPSILLAHQRDASFGDAGRFRPERFLDGEVAANTWLPFGGGVRRCIGAGFSLLEGTAILRETLRRYTVAPADGPERTRVRNITSVPRGGARVVLTAR